MKKRSLSCFPRRALCLTLGLLATLAYSLHGLPPDKKFLPGVPGLSLAGPGEDSEIDGLLTEAEVVQDVYAAAEEILRGSGYEVQIDLADFRTIYKQEFKLRQWTDLFTVDARRALVLGKHFMNLQFTNEKFLHAEARWEPRAPVVPPGIHQMKLSVVAAHVENFLAGKTLLDQPIVAEAMTSFVVDLQVEGVAESYSAAVFWLRDKAGQLVIHVKDPVAGDLATFAYETATPTPFEVVSELDKALGNARPLVGFNTKSTCLPKNELRWRGKIDDSGDVGHLGVGPSHEADINFKYQEVCEPSCQEECTVLEFPHLCVELRPDGPFGNSLVSRHEIRVATEQAQGVSCAVGQQCAVEQCFFGVACNGVTVTIDISILASGANVTFANATGAIQKFNMSSTRDVTCSVIVPPPPSPPEPPCMACCSLNNFTRTMVLNGNLELPELTPSAFRLSRLDDGATIDDLTFLLEEWAIFSVNAAPAATEMSKRAVAVEITGFSSPDFARTRYSEVWQAADAAVAQPGGEERQGTVLVVEAPVHPENSRHTELPTVRLRQSVLPFKAAPGKVLMRVFFAENGQVHAVGTLHGFDGYSSIFDAPQGLADFLFKNLELAFSAAEKHPTVVFGLFQVRGDKIQLLASERFFTRCCCGGEFCI